MTRLRAFRPLLALATLLVISLSACSGSRADATPITVQLTADGSTREITIPAGSTVEQAVLQAGVTLGNLDKVAPPAYSTLKGGEEIVVVRVSEEFETEVETIPYERQVVRNESLPEGETRLIQPGSNGQQELTYRRVLEDGVETSRTVVKTVVLTEALPEIVMVGVQAAFAPLPIPGRLAYLAGGNAWIMQDSTANRIALVTSGDLDGRVFALSPDGELLLFTRKSKKPAGTEINTLWVVSTGGQGQPVSLGVSDIVHFAAWVPGKGYEVAFSTVEPRATSPGWQANNDLYIMRVGRDGTPYKPRQVIETGYGGAYGWWGTNFAFAPNGSLAYSRPDGVGLVDTGEGALTSLLDITPLQTRSDWAWLPGLAWGADSRTVYVVNHAPPPSLVNPEESPYFDLDAISLVTSANVRITTQTGMFAYPSSSPLHRDDNGENQYQIAFLQAIFPAQSETSRYRLSVMDRDGSNLRAIFPSEDLPGLDPQTPVWSPLPPAEQDVEFVAVVYRGNLWLVDTVGGQAYQVTGDGIMQSVDWK
jgi:hypothetical protein